MEKKDCKLICRCRKDMGRTHGIANGRVYYYVRIFANKWVRLVPGQIVSTSIMPIVFTDSLDTGLYNVNTQDNTPVPVKAITKGVTQLLINVTARYDEHTVFSVESELDMTTVELAVMEYNEQFVKEVKETKEPAKDLGKIIDEAFLPVRVKAPLPESPRCKFVLNMNIDALPNSERSTAVLKFFTFVEDLKKGSAAEFEIKPNAVGLGYSLSIK